MTGAPICRMKASYFFSLINIHIFQSYSKFFSQNAAVTNTPFCQNWTVNTEKNSPDGRPRVAAVQKMNWDDEKSHSPALQVHFTSLVPIQISYFWLQGDTLGVFSLPGASPLWTDLSPHLTAHTEQRKHKANNCKPVSFAFLPDHVPLPLRRDLSYSAKRSALLSHSSRWRWCSRPNRAIFWKQTLFWESIFDENLFWPLRMIEGI